MHIEKRSSRQPLAGMRRALDSMSRLSPWTALGVGVFLMAPSVLTGWVADDDIHRLLLREEPGLRGFASRPLDLFRFADGDAGSAHQLIEEGVYPWWAEPRVTLAFFRPLACVSHIIDSRLWSESAVLMHLHSLAWYALLLILVWCAFRRFSTSANAAVLAFIAFAVDDAHAPVVGWIANRNMLMSVAFGVVSLLLHRDAQVRRARTSLLAAHVTFVLALLAGEGAYVILAYLVAYALVFDPAPLRRRLWSISGYCALAVGFRLGATLSGYGAVGSGLYLDPLRQPVAFTLGALNRFPVLLLSMFAFPSADLWDVYPLFGSYLQVLVLALGLPLLGFLARVLCRRVGYNRTARFWGLGCLLSILPLCAAFPHDRLLLGPSIGAMGVLGELFAAWVARGVEPRQSFALGLLFVVHLVCAPALALVRSADVGRLASILAAQDVSVSKHASIRQQTLVLLNPPLDPFAAYFSIYREARGEPRPKHLYWLATGVDSIVVTGVDEHTLRLRPTRGFLASSSQRMLRSAASGFERDQEVRLEDCSIRVEELTLDRRPQAILVRFRSNLDDRALAFMTWQGPGYVAFVPPAPGQSVVIPRVDLWKALFG